MVRLAPLVLLASLLAVATGAKSPKIPFPEPKEPPTTDTPRAEVDAIKLTRCVDRCFYYNHWQAGCGRSDDWACMCRSDRNLAPEVRRCIEMNCRHDSDKAILRAIETFYCSHPAIAMDKQKPLTLDFEDDPDWKLT
ncbi:hypothetical protein QBC47DRAFT_362309 [Echria macrotheca]|uniref:CFEM domain-containing protein n=1 Tax=Echria macrotheca TaxID=438768 RepID=A0AAJ0F9R4_9PEZI|nr:hypothetical protein QBC47DRAFT_362309 [Echria macrotheca]